MRCSAAGVMQRLLKGGNLFLAEEVLRNWLKVLFLWSNYEIPRRTASAIETAVEPRGTRKPYHERDTNSTF